MKKVRRELVMVVAALAGCFLLGYNSSWAHAPAYGHMGMFSWKTDVFQDDGAQLFSFMGKNGFTELYQTFPDEINSATASRFLDNARKKKLDVYALFGGSDWAMDPRGGRMRASVEEAARIQKGADGGLKGIVFDVEPYTTPEWAKNKKDIMESFVSGMKRAYNEAKNEDFEVIICIPYYYDDEGVNTGMKSLIRTGCDRVAIMNYYKSREAEHIQNEVRYANRYGKGVINIFEFKPIDKRHEIREINTYFSDGFDVALTSFGVISATYPDTDLIFAAHDYEALKEVFKRYG